jgi:DNA-binding CsgD family transcriptional regulator
MLTNLVEAGLTRRELEVLQLMARGYTNPQIAEALSLAEGTVKNHLSSIYSKIGVRSRGEAVAWAWKNELIKPGDMLPTEAEEYWNETDIADRTFYVGWDTGDEWASGGEGGGNNHGMGNTTHNNVAWFDRTTGWHAACGYLVYNNNPGVWGLDTWPHCQSWRIYGND